MSGEPLFDVGLGMGGQVVEDDVDCSAGVVGDHVVHEAEQFLGATVCEAAARHFVGGGVML
jgi:hypothetical protein